MEAELENSNLGVSESLTTELTSDCLDKATIFMDGITGLMVAVAKPIISETGIHRNLFKKVAKKK